MKWLDRLSCKREIETKIDSELRFHIEQKTAELVAAGVEPAEARRRAMAKLGGMEAIKQEYRESRGMYFLESFLADIRLAARSLDHDRGPAAAIVLLLALGIGGATALFGPLYSLVLSPLPYPHSDRIVRIGGNIPIFNGRTDTLVRPENLHVIFSHATVYSSALWPTLVVLPDSGTRPIPVQIAGVGPDFFATFGARPWMGFGFSSESGGVHEAVLSYQFWHSDLFAPRDIVGRSIRVSGQNVVVRGVMGPGFDFPSGTDIWMLGGVEAPEFVGRLRSGLSLPQAAASLKGMGYQSGPYYVSGNPGPVLESLHDFLLGDRRPLLLTLWAVSLLFFVIACAGVANLLLARGVRRRPEMALRLALGGPRPRLVRQLLAEALLLAAAGGVVGLGLGAAAGRWIALLLPAARGAKSFSPLSLALVVLLCVAATILCGLAPAFHATGADLNAFLRTGASGITPSTLRHRFLSSHEFLAAAQLTLATILLISAGLLLRSLVAHLSIPLGFQPRNVFVVETHLEALAAVSTAEGEYFSAHRPKPGTPAEATFNSDLYKAVGPFINEGLAQNETFYNEARLRLLALPGVVSVGVMNPPPFGENPPPADYEIQASAATGGEDALHVYASPNAFHLLGIHLLAGRTFTSGDAANDAEFPPQPHPGKGSAIVNEKLARDFWPRENPVGKTFAEPDHTQVVGVVSDARFDGGIGVKPTLYLPFVARTEDGLYCDFLVKIRSGTPLAGFASRVSRALLPLSPNLVPPSVVNLEDSTTKSLANLRLVFALLGCFAALGTIVAALGVYAAATLAAARRTREMGIRVALGAQAEQIRGLTVWRSVRLALVALPVGALCAWGLARSLSHWLFQVGATDPATYATSIALLATIALAAGLVPARRASRVDPVVALRQE